jgi:hypothetical protein
MSPKLLSLADSQDRIGWQNFTEGHISIHFYEIQKFHLAMSSSFLNRADWTKISKILQITHSQWIYRNTSLHNKHQEYLHNKRAEHLLKEIESFANLAPEDIPESSRFLLEINFTELTKLHLETQKYWILAVNAALTANNREQARGARAKQTRAKLNKKIPSRTKLGIIAIEQQIQKDGMHTQAVSTYNPDQQRQPTILSFAKKRPHPSTVGYLHKSNKRMRKPDL